MLRRQLERDLQCVPTSSMGRLFDAVSSLLDVRHEVSYEAQAAIELETVAAPASRSPLGTTGSSVVGGRDRCGPGAALDHRRRATAVIVAEHRRRLPPCRRRLVADVAEAARRRTGIARVALSGGVFQNVLLLRLTRAELASRGFAVLTHRTVPPNDGGLALGQVAVAAHAPRRQPRGD